MNVAEEAGGLVEELLVLVEEVLVEVVEVLEKKPVAKGASEGDSREVRGWDWD